MFTFKVKLVWNKRHLSRLTKTRHKIRINATGDTDSVGDSKIRVNRKKKAKIIDHRLLSQNHNTTRLPKIINQRIIGATTFIKYNKPQKKASPALLINGLTVSICFLIFR